MRTIDRTDKSETPKCAYCGTQNPEDGLTIMGVIHQDFNHERQKKEVVKSNFTVCDNGKCGGYLQMAHEG